MKKYTKLLAAIMIASFSTAAMAARPEGAPTAPCEGLKIATGPIGKGYSKMFANMAEVTKNRITLCEVTSSGGLENASLLSEKKADLAITTLDTLKAMQNGDENVSSLLVVSPLNSNYLHIAVSSKGFTVTGAKKYGFMEGDKSVVQITKMSQLRGQPVALVGSAALLARQIDKQLGYNMRFVDVDGKDADNRALDLVRKGTVVAAFTMGGWPHGVISKLSQDDGITLVPFDVPVQGAYVIKPFNYKNIGVYNVQALSTQNILVTRQFNGAKNQEVAKLKSLLAGSLNDLKDGEFEPGWNEIKSLDSPVDWPRFSSGAAAAVAAPKKK